MCLQLLCHVFRKQEEEKKTFSATKALKCNDFSALENAFDNDDAVDAPSTETMELLKVLGVSKASRKVVALEAGGSLVGDDKLSTVLERPRKKQKASEDDIKVAAKDRGGDVDHEGNKEAAKKVEDEEDDEEDDEDKKEAVENKKEAVQNKSSSKKSPVAVKKKPAAGLKKKKPAACLKKRPAACRMPDDKDEEKDEQEDQHENQQEDEDKKEVGKFATDKCVERAQRVLMKYEQAFDTGLTPTPHDVEVTFEKLLKLYDKLTDEREKDAQKCGTQKTMYEIYMAANLLEQTMDNAMNMELET